MSGQAAANEFLEALGRQRRDYAAALPGRLRALRQSWRGIRASRDGLQSIERAAHGLAGSGAMFGFDRLGAEARALESVLRRLIASGADPSSAAACVEAGIDRLEASLASEDP